MSRAALPATQKQRNILRAFEIDSAMRPGAIRIESPKEDYISRLTRAQASIEIARIIKRRALLGLDQKPGKVKRRRS